MTSLLRAHWQQLSGPVHPLDASVFATSHHTFNLDYPPPAFIGSPDAPVVVLMANGGYSAGVTEAEFASQGEAEAHIAWLRGERAEPPTGLAAYYRNGPLWSWLSDGQAVLVNAVPYRSPALSREPENVAVAQRLPSLALHRRWLFEEVLPAAHQGHRYVVAHRNGWWQIRPEQTGPNIEISKNPVSRSPARETMARISDWLANR